ncbi:S-layer homology domain-containing protein [Nanoarchaeota archaeon]
MQKGRFVSGLGLSLFLIIIIGLLLFSTLKIGIEKDIIGKGISPLTQDCSFEKYGHTWVGIHNEIGMTSTKSGEHTERILCLNTQFFRCGPQRENWPFTFAEEKNDNEVVGAFKCNYDQKKWVFIPSTTYENTEEAANCDFNDINLQDNTYDDIMWLCEKGITKGCSSNKFCKNKELTRDQLAIFLLRALKGKDYLPLPASGDIFNDVPVNHWAAPWIEEFSNLGITQGCDENNFCPSSKVTRSQMAIFLLRAIEGSNYSPPSARSRSYNDVPTDHWAFPWIEESSRRNIIEGCNANSFCPDRPVTRESMATLMRKTFGYLEYPYIENSEGFVYIEDGHLFRNGERIKLWGVNEHHIKGGTHNQIDYELHYAKNLGFNALRSWTPDFFIIDKKEKNPQKIANIASYSDYGSCQNGFCSLPGSFTISTRSDTKKLLDGKYSSCSDNNPSSCSLPENFDYYLSAISDNDLLVVLNMERRHVPFVKEDGLGLTGDQYYGNLNDWKAAIEKIEEDIFTQVALVYIDDRLQKLHLDYVRNMLNHRNIYPPNKRLADDPNIAIWEISNENLFVRYFTLNNFYNAQLRKNPFFVEELRIKWNLWLSKKYQNNRNLKDAWKNSLASDEKLNSRTVKLGPFFRQKKDEYMFDNERRQKDYLNFITDTFTSYNKKVVRLARDEGVKVPIIFNTGGDHHSPPWRMYADSKGEVFSTHMYYLGFFNQNLDTSPSNPLRPFEAPIKKSPTLLGDKIKGKPAIIYEGNYFKPFQMYYADYPIQIASHLSFMDFDGIFWFLWGTPKHPAKKLEYNSEFGGFQGTVIRNDQVFMSSSKIASEIFKSSYVPASSSTANIKMGTNYYFNLDNRDFAGIADYSDFSNSGTRYAYGLTYEFNDGTIEKQNCPKKGCQIQGKTINSNQLSQKNRINNPSGIDYSWKNGEYRVVRDEIISITRLSNNSIKIPSNNPVVEITNLVVDNTGLKYTLQTDTVQPNFGFNDQFHTFSIVSLDDRSLENSKHLLLSIMSKGINSNSNLAFKPMKFGNDNKKNTNDDLPGTDNDFDFIKFQLNDKGDLPINVANIDAEIIINNRVPDLICKKLNFNLNAMEQGKCDYKDGALFINFDDSLHPNKIFMIEICAEGLCEY